MGKLGGMRVAVLVAEGFDHAGLDELVTVLREAGVTVDVLADGTGPRTRPDRPLREADARAYDGLVIPSGIEGVERMRCTDGYVEFARTLAARGKPILAIGDGATMLDGSAHPQERPNVLVMHDTAEFTRTAARFLAALEREYENLSRPHVGEIETLDRGAIAFEGRASTPSRSP